MEPVAVRLLRHSRPEIERRCHVSFKFYWIKSIVKDLFILYVLLGICAWSSWCDNDSGAGNYFSWSRARLLLNQARIIVGLMNRSHTQNMPDRNPIWKFETQPGRPAEPSNILYKIWILWCQIINFPASSAMLVQRQITSKLAVAPLLFDLELVLIIIDSQQQLLGGWLALWSFSRWKREICGQV